MVDADTDTLLFFKTELLCSSILRWQQDGASRKVGVYDVNMTLDVVKDF